MVVINSIRESRNWVIKLLSLLILTVVSCQKFDESDELTPAETSKVSVSTRSMNASDVPYPVWIYAFSEAEKCIAKQIITTSEDNIKLALPVGKYQLIALAGMHSDYLLPDTPMLSDLIKLNDNVASEAAMMGKVNINLSSQSANVVINLNYIVAAFSAAFSGISPAVNQLSVHLSPLYGALSLAGDYSSGGNTVEIMCQNTGDGMWSCDTRYIFPSSGQKMAFSISLQEEGVGMKSYGYQTAILPQANYPYIIHGNYTDGMLQVEGGLVVEGWGTPIYVDFDFGPNISQDEVDTELDLSKFPEVGTIWNNTIVLKVSDITETSATLFLLSIDEWEIYRSQLASCLADYNVSGLTEWRVPTYDEAGWMNQDIRGEMVDKINDSIRAMGKTAYLLNADERYLCDKDGSIYSFAFAAGKNRAITGDGRTYLFRAVTEYAFALSD